MSTEHASALKQIEEEATRMASTKHQAWGLAGDSGGLRRHRGTKSKSNEAGTRLLMRSSL